MVQTVFYSAERQHLFSMLKEEIAAGICLVRIIVSRHKVTHFSTVRQEKLHKSHTLSHFDIAGKQHLHCPANEYRYGLDKCMARSVLLINVKLFPFRSLR